MSKIIVRRRVEITVQREMDEAEDFTTHVVNALREHANYIEGTAKFGGGELFATGTQNINGTSVSWKAE